MKISQQPAMPVIGYLSARSPTDVGYLLAAFQRGLGELGYAEGRNVAFDYRWANNQIGRLPALAADLVRQRVSVIAAVNATASALAAKAATSTIPIVFGTGADPVKAGLVTSLNRPGGNITGANTMSTELLPKRIGLLNELLPSATRFAVLVNPGNPFGADPAYTGVHEVTTAIAQKLEVFTAKSNAEIDSAFAALVQKRANAVVFSPDALFDSRRVQLATLAARYQLPALHWKREFPETGGLMSYGSNVPEVIRQTGIYAGRILRGAAADRVRFSHQLA